MTVLNEIKYVDWQFKLNGIGDVAEGVEDINQCIATIINTPKGSDPHRPTFGSNIYKYVGYANMVGEDSEVYKINIIYMKNKLKK